ncbi:EF-hand calcium-binding domain-containing protein 10-like [Centruroides vittatus]|uniref:EF-hand calcium-binding domain-containing protein 10-like n=1 Tax=Centruroides vittatus TaxID=120091 RepID=UPI00350EC004
MESDRKTVIEKYLKKHRIQKLFEMFLSQLIIYQPENPQIFLADFVHKLILGREDKSLIPVLFTEKNIVSFFNQMDINKTGRITLEQYDKAFKHLSDLEFDPDPPQHESSCIPLAVFLHNVNESLKRSMTMF